MSKENKYKFTVKDIITVLDDYGIIPKEYVEVNKSHAKKEKKPSR
jgi:hypothetical protein